MNEIKLDKLNLLLSSGKIEKNVQKPQKPVEQEGVTVTNHLNQLTSLLSFGDPIPHDNARVLEMKQRIQSNEYTVDVNNLADKLINSGALTIES